MLTALFDSLERLTLHAGLERLAGPPAPEHVADALWLASQLSLSALDNASWASPSVETTDGNGLQQQTDIHEVRNRNRSTATFIRRAANSARRRK